jgi:hypothetical protein
MYIMYIVQTSSTKFLGLIIGYTLFWEKKKNTHRLYTAKLNSACFVIRTIKSLLSKDALKML